MNKTFKVVFNKARKALVAVNEATLTSSQARGSYTRTAITLMACLGLTNIAVAADNWQSITTNSPLLLTKASNLPTENFDIQVNELSSGQEDNLFGTINIQSKNTVNIHSALPYLSIKNETINIPKTDLSGYRAAIYIKSTDVNIKANDLSISSAFNPNAQKRTNSAGLYANNSNISINSTGIVEVKASNTTNKAAVGIRANGGTTSIKSNNSILISSSSLGTGIAKGVDANNASVVLDSDNITFDILQKNKSQNGYIAINTNKSSNININASHLTIKASTPNYATASVISANGNADASTSRNSIAIKTNDINIINTNKFIDAKDNSDINISANTGYITGTINAYYGTNVTINNDTNNNLTYSHSTNSSGSVFSVASFSPTSKVDGNLASNITINADNIYVKSSYSGTNDTSIIFAQSNTQNKETQTTGSKLNIHANNIKLEAEKNIIDAFSNSTVNISGNIIAKAGDNILETRGNSIVNINSNLSDNLKTILKGDIAFKTPDDGNSGNLINSDVSIGLLGKDSSWTGRSYQQRGKDAEKTVAIDVDDAVYGKVTGFKATLAEGGTWNVTGDSFINSLTLKDGGIVNASDAVKTLNIGDLTVEGTGNQLTLANAGAVNGTINFADGAGLSTALNTAYTINDADKLDNGAVNNATGRLTLGTVGKDASLTISDAFTYTQDGLKAIASAYGSVTVNVDNASLYVDPSDTNKEFNIKKGTIGLIARGNDAITGGADSLIVDNNATLNIKSSASTNVATATEIKVNGTMNVTDASLSVDTLNLAENAQVNIGTPTSAGELHVAELTSAARSKVFLDPAWQDGATIADASFMSAASLTGNTIEGDIAVGQNSVVALNASKAAAVNAFNKTCLTWGADDVTAALFIGAPTTVFGSINVNGVMTADTGAIYGTPGRVSIQNHGLLMVDQTGVGSSAAINGSLTLASGSYVGIANADAGSVILATEVADDGATVVTDNPFLEGAINGNSVDVSVSPTGGLGALASTGIQAMTRRADTVLAQTIADRTSVDQELAAGTNLWVDVTGERYEADKLDNGGEFKSDMGYGAFGADFAVTQDITAGAAFQYGKGTLRSGVSSIKNSIDSYGVTAYGAMKFGEAKVVAEASYVKNENDITSSQTALNQSVDSEIYSVGVRGQHRFTAGNFQFVPSVGVRVSRLNTDAMQVGAVNIKKQEQTLVQVPIALRVNGFEQNVSGWSVAPSFKVAYVPTFGDKEISVLGADQTVIDTSPVQGDFGIRAQNGNLMVNANMMLGGGKDGTSSVGGKVGLKYVF